MNRLSARNTGHTRAIMPSHVSYPAPACPAHRFLDDALNFLNFRRSGAAR